MATVLYSNSSVDCLSVNPGQKILRSAFSGLPPLAPRSPGATHLLAARNIMVGRGYVRRRRQHQPGQRESVLLLRRRLDCRRRNPSALGLLDQLVYRQISATFWLPL